MAPQASQFEKGHCRFIDFFFFSHHEDKNKICFLYLSSVFLSPLPPLMHSIVMTQVTWPRVIGCLIRDFPASLLVLKQAWLGGVCARTCPVFHHCALRGCCQCYICMSLKIQNLCTSGRCSWCCWCSSADVSIILPRSLLPLLPSPTLTSSADVEVFFLFPFFFFSFSSPHRPKNTHSAGKSVLFECLMLMEASSLVKGSQWKLRDMLSTSRWLGVEREPCAFWELNSKNNAF